MKGNIRDKFDGVTIEERLAQIPAELAIDAVGLWHIFLYGHQGFGLSGTDLVNYMRRHILALLAKGAKPVAGAMDGIHYWKVVDYGKSPEEIANAIIAKWQASGRDPDVGDVWFALPRFYEATKPSIEEKLPRVTAELADSPVSLGDIASNGRFGVILSDPGPVHDVADPRLIDYVRRQILAFLAAGAKPVTKAKDGVHRWRVVDYGRSPGEIADAIIAEWQATGEHPHPVDSIHFALPHIYEAAVPHAANKDARKPR